MATVIGPTTISAKLPKWGQDLNLGTTVNSLYSVDKWIWTSFAAASSSEIAAVRYEFLGPYQLQNF